MRRFIYGKQTNYIKIEKLMWLARAYNVLRARQKLLTLLHEKWQQFEFCYILPNMSLSVSQKIDSVSEIGRLGIQMMPVFVVCNFIK